MAHVEEVDKATLWGGDGSPFRLTYGKQMMWFFLVSDALTFGGLLISYMFARHAVDSWPIAEKVFHALPGIEGHFPLIYVALMTFILIISSVTMVLAVEAGHRQDKKGVTKWLLATVVGGFIFVGSQAWEWSHFIHGSHHGTYLTTEGWATPNKMVYELDDHGHIVMEDGHAKYTALNLQFIEGRKYQLTGEAIDKKLAEGTLAEDGKTFDGFKESGLLTTIDGERRLYLETDQYKDLGGRLNSSDPDSVAMFHEAVALLNAHTSHIQGANLIQNEYAPNAPAFADLFFFITGFHGFHVFSGVIINLLILLQVVRGAYDKRGHFEMVEKSGLYWHFVDLVWVFVFTFFYLL